MRIITFITLVIVGAACNKANYDTDVFYKKYGNNTEDVNVLLEKVSNQKVYFGHQSVGRNILEGVDAWKIESGITLEVVDSRDFDSLLGVPFIHFSIGQNGDLRGKVDDFVSLMAKVPTEEKPIAFFKLCFLDVTDGMDVNSEFEYFKEKMISLKDQYPGINFVVFTVPYTGVQKGAKAIAKKILKRTPYGVLDNIKRQEFNQKILHDFKGIMPVFDLAALESTYPDGSIETFHYKGDEYPCMPLLYRSDYGHLNDFGARTVSYNLLAFLSEEF